MTTENNNGRRKTLATTIKEYLRPHINLPEDSLGYRQVFKKCMAAMYTITNLSACAV